MTPPILTGTGLDRSYRIRDTTGRRREVTALRGVDVSLASGASLAVVGESGSGKSTLARLLVGLEAPDRGSVELAGRDLHCTRGRDRRELQRRIQMIFQDPYRSLNPRMTVRSALRFVWRSGDESAGFDEDCERMMGLVRLPLDYLTRRPGSLSGGERQRVSIARALMSRPDVVVADEAVSALDRSVQADVLNLIADLRSRLGLTLLYITHDVHTVSAVCDDVIVLHHGIVVEHGSTSSVLSNPQDDYTRALVDAAPTVVTALEERGLLTDRAAS